MKKRMPFMLYTLPVDKSRFPVPTHAEAVMQNHRFGALHALVSIKPPGLSQERCEKLLFCLLDQRKLPAISARRKLVEMETSTVSGAVLSSLMTDFLILTHCIV
jgi:hypothetical protein